MDLPDGRSDPWELQWGQTAKVLCCLSPSRYRLRSRSVCRWKDTLTSVCHRLGALHKSLQERMAAVLCLSPRSHIQRWKLLALLAGLNTGNSSRFVFFLIITGVVSTSLTFMVSPAGYCWTLPCALTGVCVTYQRQCRNSSFTVVSHVLLLLNELKKPTLKPLTKYLYFI